MCLHKWTNWSKAYRTTDEYLEQFKGCRKCGIVKTREVSPSTPNIADPPNAVFLNLEFFKPKD